MIEFLLALGFQRTEQSGMHFILASHNLLIIVKQWQERGSLNQQQISQHIESLHDYRSQGLEVLVIGEDQWKLNPKLVQSFIMNRIEPIESIFARDVRVVAISDQEANLFLSSHHLLGFAKGSSYWALVMPSHRLYRFKKQLPPETSQLIVAVAVLGKKIKMNQIEFKDQVSVELIRFASLFHYRVVGGLSKMIQSIMKTEQAHNLMTYVDIETNDSKGLQSFGFKLESITPPLYFQLDETGSRITCKNLNDAELVNAGNYKLRYVGH